MEHRVLIVDDVPELAALLERQIRKHGFEPVVANTGAQALVVARSGFRGIILLDLMLPDVNGLELLDELQAIDKDNPVLIMTAHGTVDLATEALKKGALDFLEKDKLTERLVVSLKNASRSIHYSNLVQRLSEELEERFQYHHIISHSSQMKRIVETLKQIEDSNVTVLIQGESGTGKELVARAIHFRSSRRKGPFVAINCAGIPASLLESELFGYQKGAFTGATQNKIGKFEAANGGTIFLDEISEMDPNLQSKILRVLQEREVEPLGSNEHRKLDLRIVSATNRVLIDEVRAGRFREDLYYRLSVFPILLPPLRERAGDVVLLAGHFVEKFCTEEGKHIKGFSREAIDALEAYNYPGNVRELENIISHAVVVASGERIEPDDLPPHLRQRRTATGQQRAVTRLPTLPGAAPMTGPFDLRQSLQLAFPSEAHIPTFAELEREMCRHTYELCGKNIRQSALRLGVSRPLIYRRLKEIADLEKAP
jgi:DNA-binding NtrC family response regulator